MEKTPVNHNRLQRKEGHDYASACIYLITVTTVDRKHVLGTLVGGSPDDADIEPTSLGLYTAQAFRAMAEETTQKTGSRVQVLHYKIMPDHFHGMLYVRDPLPKGWSLGRLIAAWKSDCTHEYWRGNAELKSRERNEEKSADGNATGSEGKNAELKSREQDEEKRNEEKSESAEPLFSAGFNDKILFHKGQKEAWISYLDDNPRRLWLKVHYPDRLKKVYDFKVGKQGHSYTAVGNTFLVKYPERMQVRCHRNLTDEQIHAEVEHYMRIARSGAVLVSPFISPAEKAVYEACYKEKLPMIHIVNRGLDGKFIYPSGRDLTGCTDGFMLVLAPYADYSKETAAARITRSQCLDMNGYAADIASITEDKQETRN